MKNYFILSIILLMLSPALTAVGFTDVTEPDIVYTPTGDELNGDIAATIGDTLYYDIDQLSVPVLGDGFPDLTGNQIYIKIMAISEDTAPDRKNLHFAVGMYFTKDTAFTIGEGLLETDIIIPKDTATPSVSLTGNAHFNDSYGGPLVFILNQEWDIHMLMLEALGLTVVNGGTTFEAGFDNATGTVDLEWRKSDGYMTRFFLDDVYFMGMNLTGSTIELNLDRVENTPFDVDVGDELTINMDSMDITFSGSGPVYDEINQTEVTEVIDTYKQFEGNTMFKYVVEEVEGLYYVCSYFYYDLGTEQLVKATDYVLFSGFMGSYQSSEPPLYANYMDISYIGGFYAPFISPDWDLYEAQMTMYNTLLDVYVDDILNAISINTEMETFHLIGGNAEYTSKRDYKYFRMGYGSDYEYNESYSTSIFITILEPNAVYDYGTRSVINVEGYLAYHESGEMAAFRIAADYSMTYNNVATASETGTYIINIDIKLRNPEYDPPDVLGGGFIPGFTWAIVIPTLIGIAAYGLITRKKRR